MYRIRKLEVTRFRGLAAPATFTFGDRYHLVVGDNGAGKTNLLKLLAMITRLDFSPLVDESFEVAWEADTGDGGRVVGRVARELVGSPAAGGGRDRARWAWSLSLDTPGMSVQHGARQPVQGEGVRGSPGDPCGSFALWTMTSASDLWAGRGVRWQADRADEALGSFAALLGAVEPGGTMPFTPWLSAAAGAPIVAHFGEGAALNDEWLTSATAGNYLPIASGSIPWLEAVRRDFGATSITLRPKFDHRRPVDENHDIIQFRGCDVHATFSPHVAVSQDKLSFGQKRLLGLRYYLATGPEAPAIIDELSNGLHHTWVQALVGDLELRQSFLATQNPLLMDSVWWDSAEEAGRGIILCTRDGAHRWVWRQLNPAEATVFYEAWRTGIQQIHEVLKTEGWW